MVKMPETFGELVKTMRRQGVRLVECEGLRIEMQPRRPRVGKAVEQGPWGASELCRCGHPLEAHNEHGCLMHPCPPEVCQEGAVG